MLDYLWNPESDFHRDTAADAFKMAPEQITKSWRQIGKGIVFAAFFGDDYRGITVNTWDTMLKDAPELITHLAGIGITARGDCKEDRRIRPVRGTFEHHMKQTMDKFWGERFRVYGQWRNRRVAEYDRDGFFVNHTGFTFSGPMRRNVIINSPIQSSAFHCTLRSIILINNELTRRGLRSKIVSTIHDSIIGDVHADEFEEVDQLVKHFMVEDLKANWKWLDPVPVEVDGEACEVGQSWHDKVEF